MEKANIFNGYFARTCTLKEVDSTLPKVQTPEPNIEVIMFTATGLFYVNWIFPGSLENSKHYPHSQEK
jgi:hypothetical protein